MEERNDILKELGVSIYKRDGKWYWMIKSHSFDSPEGALKDSISTFSRETEKKDYTVDSYPIKPTGRFA